MCARITNQIPQFMLNINNFINSKTANFKRQHRSKTIIMRAYIGWLSLNYWGPISQSVGENVFFFSFTFFASVLCRFLSPPILAPFFLPLPFHLPILSQFLSPFHSSSLLRYNQVSTTSCLPLQNNYDKDQPRCVPCLTVKYWNYPLNSWPLSLISTVNINKFPQNVH